HLVSGARMPEVVSLGVDLGGTKIEAAVLRRWNEGADERFEVLVRRRVPTGAEGGYEAVLEATLALIRGVAADIGRRPEALPTGLGMPGSITRREGLVKNSNTVCLNGRPFRQDLGNALGGRVEFENDANCFALAEARLGAGRAYRDGIVFGVILGTGVGGGIVVNGRVWGGLQGIAGEWGHHAVGPWRSADRASEAADGRELGLGLAERGPCYCGKTGCLELYASGPAVERDYLRRTGRHARLPEIAARRANDPDAAPAGGGRSGGRGTAGSPVAWSCARAVPPWSATISGGPGATRGSRKSPRGERTTRTPRVPSMRCSKRWGGGSRRSSTSSIRLRSCSGVGSPTSISCTRRGWSACGGSFSTTSSSRRLSDTSSGIPRVCSGPRCLPADRKAQPRRIVRRPFPFRPIPR